MGCQAEQDPQDLTPIWCDCCKKKTCIPRRGKHLQEYIKNKDIMSKLGVDLQDTERLRTMGQEF